MSELEVKIKPDKWGRLTNAPYYREKYALELKGLLDAMMFEYEHGTHAPRIIQYIDYPEISHTSLYLRFNQSKLFLLENMDPEKRYLNFLELLSINRLRRRGIGLSYEKSIHSKPLVSVRQNSGPPPEVRNDLSVEAPINEIPVAIQKEDLIPTRKDNWKFETQKFLDEGKIGDNLNIKNLQLTKTDGEFIQMLIEKSKQCILTKVTVETIFMAKVTQEQFDAINK